MKKWHKIAFVTSCTITAVACVIGLGVHTSKQRQRLSKTSIPLTAKEVRQYTGETTHLFDTHIQKLLGQDTSSQNFTNTILHWDEIGLILIERMAVLKSLAITGASKEILDEADAAYRLILDHVTAKMSTQPKIPLALIAYLEKALSDDGLSQAQWHNLHQLASTIEPSWFPLLLQNKIEMMKEKIASKDKQSFTYLRSDRGEKAAPEANRSFTLLNLNVCFLPGSLPLLYGGVKPWAERLDSVANRILSLDADIVCLQEVFERKAALELFNSLKKRYTHFYLHIGPKNFGLSHSSAGLSSGLFVASKIPLTNPCFVSFEKKNENVNRGFFHFDVILGSEPVAHIYTTHLEAFNDAMSQENRKDQLLTMLQTMQSKDMTDKKDTPQIICGDLNIPWGSSEAAEKILKTHFTDTYSNTIQKLSYDNRTYVDFTDFWWKAQGDVNGFSPKPEILDYAAVLKNPCEGKREKPVMITAVCPMNTIEKPKEAISDHHGLISLIFAD